MVYNQIVLVSGASGFVATHIVDAFLSAGYSVRGTVRSEETADKVRRTFPQHEAKLSFTIVSDIGKPNAFDDAVKGVDGVIHTASPAQFQVEDNERDLLHPAINGTMNILNSIQKNAPGVKRVVITSSFASMVDLSKGDWPCHIYNEADWNPMTYEEAAKKNTPGTAAYCAAKSLAERAAWSFVEHETPRFDVATICPPMVYGPNKNATANLEKLNFSSQDIYQLMSPMSKPSDPVPENSFWCWVDVRDVAQAHLRAFELPEAGNQRFFVCKGNYSFQQIADILREHVPEVRDRVPIGKPGGGSLAEIYKTNASRSEEVLGIKYHELQQTVVDAAMSLLDLEKTSP